MRAAIDDMLGQFDRTSDAYKEGVRAGREEMRRRMLSVVEALAWQREGSKQESTRAEFDTLLGALAEMRAAQMPPIK